MHRILIAALLVMAALTALAAPALADEATTQPTETPLQKILRTAEEARTWARWGFVLSLLALAGVLWVVWSMQTLAKNQIQLGRMIQSAAQE